MVVGALKVWATLWTRIQAGKAPTPKNLKEKSVYKNNYQTLSMEIFDICGNIKIMADYLLLFSFKTFFILKTLYKNLNILHIYTL